MIENHLHKVATSIWIVYSGHLVNLTVIQRTLGKFPSSLASISIWCLVHNWKQEKYWTLDSTVLEQFLLGANSNWYHGLLRPFRKQEEKKQIRLTMCIHHDDKAAKHIYFFSLIGSAGYMGDRPMTP